eukprot:2006481-Alexandrium_andersonii.AAC.1
MAVCVVGEGNEFAEGGEEFKVPMTVTEDSNARRKRFPVVVFQLSYKDKTHPKDQATAIDEHVVARI